MKVMKRYILALTVLASGGLAFAQSGSEATDSVNQEQSQTVVKALFEYPVAPAEITGLQEKSDWLMEHFWDGFNPKKQVGGSVCPQPCVFRICHAYAVGRQGEVDSVGRPPDRIA